MTSCVACRGCGSCVNSTLSSRSAASQQCASPTSSPVWRCCAGASRCGSNGTTSRLAATQNAFIESFNARLRDELLNETLFTSLVQVRAVLTAWKNDYNDVRPHSALGNLTPTGIAALPDCNRAGRCATLRAPPPRRCSTQPCRLKCHRDSPHCWMTSGA
jgi:hypothetical protein